MANDTESVEMPEAPVVPNTEAAAPAVPPAVNRSFKSFKRKYGKQKIKFEAVMKDSTALAREEMRIHDLSKRLREQNDQLLELLLELNNTVHIPRSLRYNLSREEEDSQLQTTISEQPDSIPIVECDAQTARAKLDEAKQKLLAGEMTADECKALELSMLKSNTFAPTTGITSLLKNVPHTTQPPDDAPDGDLDAALGFIHPEDDVDYLIPSEPRRIDLTNARSTSKHLPVADRDKALLIRNPSSVYNWLRKHKPQVFAHDPAEAPAAGASSAHAGAGGTAQSDKPGAAPRSSSTRSKRASAQVHKEEEVYDEDGVLVDTAEPTAHTGGGGGRSKRKREEDGMYHPKGGNRGRKKRDEKRAKRPSTASTAAAAS
ncbi:hypothetical protein MGYG_05676 [Nannizzia gypsea CBS 118893]|uniref:IEC3 subunit of the Ino80 complex, chromatin re-modelling-domain-containing protein n=1 Tax=Arthroderma gypseum (strain ATCC MYA-4604 / CBS 118893) TaxID=535722 RepID=E4UX92_ARTGP|nr:hypothetical protein MGYG_05676 [Nannizzia gypsea CBS 118893]EFR02679.1 hypothetical protein MGYG_05676 [Nannizzia gypsea CBS 118893]